MFCAQRIDWGLTDWLTLHQRCVSGRAHEQDTWVKHMWIHLHTFTNADTNTNLAFFYFWFVHFYFLLSAHRLQLDWLSDILPVLCLRSGETNTDTNIQILLLLISPRLTDWLTLYCLQNTSETNPQIWIHFQTLLTLLISPFSLLLFALVPYTAAWLIGWQARCLRSAHGWNKFRHKYTDTLTFDVIFNLTFYSLTLYCLAHEITFFHFYLLLSVHSLQVDWLVDKHAVSGGAHGWNKQTRLRNKTCLLLSILIW